MVSSYKDTSLLIITHYTIYEQIMTSIVPLYIALNLFFFFKDVYVKKSYNFRGVYGSNRLRFALNPSLNLVIAGWKGGQSLPTDQYELSIDQDIDFQYWSCLAIGWISQ